tara:strand:+ start:353 stop:472 length:120 start_codon:yes stop_codon:yes gene_type:complete
MTKLVNKLKTTNTDSLKDSFELITLISVFLFAVAGVNPV